jgi:hypothetical protein
MGAERAIGIATGVVAGSIALTGFGINSFPSRASRAS